MLQQASTLQTYTTHDFKLSPTLVMLVLPVVNSLDMLANRSMEFGGPGS